MTQDKPRFEVGDTVYYPHACGIKISKYKIERINIEPREYLLSNWCWAHFSFVFKTFKEAQEYLLDQVNNLVEE